MNTKTSQPALCLIIQAANLKKLFKAIKTVARETTIRIDDDGLKINSLGDERIALLEGTLFSKAFEEYSCPKQFDLTISTKVIYDFLSKVPDLELITIGLIKNEQLVLKAAGKIKKELKLDLYELTPYVQKSISGKFPSSLCAPVAFFKEVINNLQAECYELYLTANPDEIIFKTESGSSSIEVALLKEDFTDNHYSVEEEAKCTYPFHYVRSFISFASGDLFMSFETNKPIKFAYHFERDEQTVGYMKYLIAPRIAS